MPKMISINIYKYIKIPLFLSWSWSCDPIKTASRPTFWVASWEMLIYTSWPAGVALIPNHTGFQVDTQQISVAASERTSDWFQLSTAAAAAFLCWFPEDGLTGPVSDSELRGRLLERDVLHEVFLLQTELFQVDWSGLGRLHFIWDSQEVVCGGSCSLVKLPAQRFITASVFYVFRRG